MNIFCRVDDCRYMECGFCKRGDISISEDLECEYYESYLDTEEWKKPFWKRMLDKDNNRTCRVQYYGKEIEYNGRKFFVENKSAYANLTDEITGMLSGTIGYVKDNLALIIKAATEVSPPILDLPIAIYDEKTRTFHYQEKGGAK